MSRIVLADRKLTPPPHVNFSNFQAEEIFFHFVIFWDASMRKEQQQPPGRLILLKFGQNIP